MNREYHRWFSPSLHRDMELLVFGSRGARMIVFPTRQGRFFDYENWGLVSALTEQINSGSLQLFCVDSIDSESLYCDKGPPQARLARHRQYERYILDEVLPFTVRANPQPFLIAHGCSIGAYHAVTLALRHPRLFGKVVGLSGRYDLTKPAGPFRDLFDGYYDQDVYFHTPVHFVANLDEESMLADLRRLEIVLAVGSQDPFHESTITLSTQLWAKGVWNALHVWDGDAHRARYWREMVKLYL
ncbi:MAG: alpha/beta hydrolase-fold protein [Bryobacteraceae bacterium]